MIRQSLGMALAGAAGLAVVPFTHQSNGAWLVTGALMVFKPGYGETVRTAVVRALATVAGAAVAGAIAAEAVVRRSFGVFMLFITPLSILLSNVIAPGDWQVAYLRLADVAAGPALAILAATLLRAWRANDTPTHLPRES